MAKWYFVNDENLRVERAYYKRFTPTDIVRIDGKLYKMEPPGREARRGDLVLHCGEKYTVTETCFDSLVGRRSVEFVRSNRSVRTDKASWYRVITPYGHEEESVKQEKPPLGITPRFILEEKRMDEIAEGLARYASAYKQIPLEWVEEYNELAERERNK